jgi:hypothetical protein
MKSRRPGRLAFEVDKLTTSIENVHTGKNFETEISNATLNDLKRLVKDDWLFDWVSEFLDEGREVYKLTTRENPSVIQGLISLTERHDHVFVYLIENAPFNIGKKKVYAGVAPNLMAFACKRSFELGYRGVVSFTAKTRLMAHYEKTLGAKRFAYNQMFIDTEEAKALMRRYFPNFQL